jgi:hypothetical protein
MSALEKEELRELMRAASDLGLGDRIDRSWTLAAMGTLERGGTHGKAPDGRGARRRAI